MIKATQYSLQYQTMNFQYLKNTHTHAPVAEEKYNVKCSASMSFPSLNMYFKPVKTNMSIGL